MYKAVIVDDENIVRVALGTIIDWHQYQFEVAGTASNGEEAMKLIRQKPIDLVVTDLKMPAMNGLDLIENLKQEGFEGEVVILSNYDDFEMVRKGLTLGAADYLLKFTISPESFAEVLEKIKGRLDEKQKDSRRNPASREERGEYEEFKTTREWQALLRGEASRDLLQTRNYLPQKGKKLVLFYLQIEYEASTWKWEDEREKFLPSVSNIVRGIFEEDKELYIVPVAEFAIAVLYREEDCKQISIPEKAEQIASLLQIYLNVQADVVYSTWFENPQKAAALFAEAQNTMRRRFYRKEPLLAAMEIAAARETEQALADVAAGLPGRLLPSVKERDLTACQAELARFEKRCEGNLVRPEQLKGWMRTLLEECAAKLLAGKPERSLPEAILQELQKAREVSRMEGAVMQGLRWISEESRADQYGGYRREVSEILQYIDQHTDKKLTLADIAQQINMNESYMCTVFKEQVGKSIISYINEKKMHLAVQLIESTDIYIKEVASRVGISDPFYFNRLFKKYYGVTPSKYKEQMAEGKGGEPS